MKQGWQRAMDVIISATSLSADRNLGDCIRPIASGYEAELIDLDGDPLRDITALEHVAFLMKGAAMMKESR